MCLGTSPFTLASAAHHCHVHPWKARKKGTSSKIIITKPKKGGEKSKRNSFGVKTLTPLAICCRRLW